MRESWPEILYDVDEWPDEVGDDGLVALRLPAVAEGEVLVQSVTVRLPFGQTLTEGELITINDELYRIMQVLEVCYTVAEQTIKLSVKPCESPLDHIEDYLSADYE